MMHKKLSGLNLASLTLAAVLCGAGNLAAQVAGGSTTVDVAITESTQVALGWSVKKTLMGKTIYNESGDKVGKIQDLIISPDKNVSYVIVGAGGFIGIGRHDVAIPVKQIQDMAGKLVMAGATKDMIKSMPAFAYASDDASRAQLVAAAEKDLASARTRVAELEKSAGVAATDAKGKLDLQITAIKVDMQSVEARLAEMKKAAAAHWKQFEAGVGAATTRLRKSVKDAVA